MTDADRCRASSAPEIEVDIAIDDDNWHNDLPDAVALCSAAVRAALSVEVTACEVSILLTDDSAVVALNEKFRDRIGPTNVLSFANVDPYAAVASRKMLGDIVLARETVTREAAAQGKRLADHVSHLVVHGALLLIGLDHQSDGDAAAMEGKEAAILAALGIADPYAIQAIGRQEIT